MEKWRNSPKQSRSLYFEISLYSLACAACFVEFSWSDSVIITDALNDDKLCVFGFNAWLLNFDKTYSNHSAIWNNSIWLMMNIFTRGTSISYERKFLKQSWLPIGPCFKRYYLVLLALIIAAKLALKSTWLARPHF